MKRFNQKLIKKSKDIDPLHLLKKDQNRPRKKRQNGLLSALAPSG